MPRRKPKCMVDLVDQSDGITCGDESSSLSSYLPGDIVLRDADDEPGKFIPVRCSFMPGKSDVGMKIRSDEGFSLEDGFFRMDRGC